MSKGVFVDFSQPFKSFKDIVEVFGDILVEVVGQMLNIRGALDDLQDGLDHSQLNVERFLIFEFFELLWVKIVDQPQTKLFLDLETWAWGAEEQQAEVQVNNVWLFGHVLFNKGNSFFHKFYSK